MKKEVYVKGTHHSNRTQYEMFNKDEKRSFFTFKRTQKSSWDVKKTPRPIVCNHYKCFDKNTILVDVGKSSKLTKLEIIFKLISLVTRFIVKFRSGKV